MDDPLHDHAATVVDEPMHAPENTNDGREYDLSTTEQPSSIESSTSGKNDISNIFETVGYSVDVVSQTSEDSVSADMQSLEELMGTAGSPKTQVVEPKAKEVEVVSAFAPRFVELPIEPVVGDALVGKSPNALESAQEVELPLITPPTQEQGLSNEEFLAALNDSTENFSNVIEVEQTGLNAIDESEDKKHKETAARLQSDDVQDPATSSLENDVDDLVESIVSTPQNTSTSEATTLDDENLTLTGIESGQIVEDKPTVDFSGIEKTLPANSTAELLGLIDRQEDIAYSPALGQSLEGLFGNEPIIAPPPSEPTKKRLNRKARILVVDDARVVRMKMSAVLTDAGFDLIQAVDGKQALDILLSEAGMGVDMVLSDIEMPNMNGLELFERLKSNPDLSQIPFAVVTGNYENIEAATRLGCVYALLKPFSDEDVENLVASCLSTVYEGFD
jgi:CheY-like chemotaxis protein